ncbi:type II secretion system protein [bacterium]|nr:MAG: type II secretion system protein [bacterium]
MTNTKKLLQTNSAFTLVELLVVMVIIAILVVAGLAGLNYAQRAARDTARLADTRSVVTYIQDYYRQYKQYPTALTRSGQIIYATMPSGGNYGTGITMSTKGLNAINVLAPSATAPTTAAVNTSCGTSTADSWRVVYQPSSNTNPQTFFLYACQESGGSSENLSPASN